MHIQKSAEMAHDELFADLVGSREFQRLRSIRFLGAIDYFLVRNPNGSWGNRRHTRYEHTLGVAELALKYAVMRCLPEKDLRLVYTAALLHDIGHGPFSHSAENVFRTQFGIDHHTAATAIITGKSPLGDDIHRVLIKHAVDVDQVLSLISGKDNSYDGVFSGPINLDTIDGILRTRKYLRVTSAYYSRGDVLASYIRKSTRSDMDRIDQFWAYKQQSYDFIQSYAGLMSDRVIQAIVSDDPKLQANDFYKSEKELIRRNPELSSALRNGLEFAVSNFLNEEKLSYYRRRFFVDSNQDFFSSSPERRYKQSKEMAEVTLKTTSGLRRKKNVDELAIPELFED